MPVTSTKLRRCTGPLLLLQQLMSGMTFKPIADWKGDLLPPTRRRAAADRSQRTPCQRNLTRLLAGGVKETPRRAVPAPLFCTRPPLMMWVRNRIYRNHAYEIESISATVATLPSGVTSLRSITSESEAAAGARHHLGNDGNDHVRLST